MTEPFQVRVVPEPRTASEKLDVVIKVLNLVYAAVMGYQVLKIVLPEVAVYEKIVIAKLQKKFGKREKLTDEQVLDFVAEVTQYVREHEDE